jgi:hypothetical protein
VKIAAMNKPHRILLVLACASLAAGTVLPGKIFAAAKTAPAANKQEAGTGTLVIVRSANLGQTIVGVSVDGEQKGKLNFNGRYEAPLSAGQHVISTIPIPNREHAQPSVTKLNVQPGKTYSFTAVRADVAIVLK